MLLLIFLADLAGAGGPRVKRVSMELGGNAPFVVYVLMRVLNAVVDFLGRSCWSRRPAG